MIEWPRPGEIRKRYDRGDEKHKAIYIILKYEYNRPGTDWKGVYRCAEVRYIPHRHNKFSGITGGFMIYKTKYKPESLMLDEKLTQIELDKLIVELL